MRGIRKALNAKLQVIYNALCFWKERSDIKYKGDRFEEWVVSHSNIHKDGSYRGYWRLLDWRSDKFIDGYYATNNKAPDLLLECIYNSQQSSYNIGDTIAVECKWREVRSFFLDKDKIYGYESYLRQNRPADRPTTLFYVFGFGWENGSPLEVYVVPSYVLYKYFLNPNTNEYQLQFTKSEVRDRLLPLCRIQNDRLIYLPSKFRDNLWTI